MTFDLSRFRTAQDDGTYDDALAELGRGRKTGHWMWFVFPQIEGLGSSPTALRYAISGLDEAREYLADPVLGPRLADAAHAVLDAGVGDPGALLGGIDAVKLRSSMTLFEAAAGGGPGGRSPDRDGPGHADDSAWSVFSRVLDQLYAGARDPETLRRL